MKWLSFAFFLFFSAVISFHACVWAGEKVNSSSTLVFEKPTDILYPSGNFVLKWNASTRHFSAYRSDDISHIIWQSLPGQSFLGAASGVMEFDEKAGSFDLHDKVNGFFPIQKIASIHISNDSVILKGILWNKKKTDSVNYVMTWKAKDDTHLDFNIILEQTTANRIYFTYASDTNEVIVGFGEQPTHFNHKGNKVPVWVQEQGIGRGDIKDPLIKMALGASSGYDYSSYIAVPQYFTSKNKSLFLDNYEYSEFDFTQKDRVEIKLFSKKLNGTILYGKSPLELITAYTEFSGRMRSLPDWISKGAVIGMQGGTDKVYKVWNRLASVQTPIAAFWLQDWVGQRTTIAGKQLWWNWTLDTLQYPKWNIMKDSLDSKGIALMGYINPFLVDVSLDKTHPYRKNYFKEAEEKGFLVKDEKGNTYEISNGTLKSSLVDLSNPAAKNWMKSIIKDEMLSIGFKGWMADFAEALPLDAHIFSGKPSSFHNQYTEEWAKLNREAIEEAGLGNDVVFFMRSAYSKSPRYSTLFWAGDQSVDWGKNDGMRSALTCVINSGCSGFSLNHSDIGGFVSIDFPIAKKIIRNEEVLRRWMEMSAFHTVFRTHEGVKPDVNVQVYDSPSIASHFAFYAKVYASWHFYRKELMKEASEKGWPVIRHPSLVFPNDEMCWNIGTEQFMVGNEWMVAPVLSPNSETVEMYLPKGNWVNLWTGDSVQSDGRYFTITGLKDKPAVLYPEGSDVTERFKQELLKHGISVP